MPSLNKPQAAFLALPHKFRAYVGGFGAGKTWAGCAAQCKHFWEHPRIHSGYFAPTYAQIRDIFFPTIEEVAHDWGLKAQLRQANKEVHLYAGRQYRGSIVCRSMEKPDTIVGFKIGRALVDEIDTLPVPKAERAWRKIIARLRLRFAGQNGVDVTTTPEGYRFVHRQWIKAVRENPDLAALYGMVQASTHDNAANLPQDYIPALLATYPPQLIEAYLNGRFVNLASGSVYSAYDRVRNACDDAVRVGEVLHIGMDFNVGRMTAIVHVKRGGGAPRAVAEFTRGLDTPDLIRRIQERYWRWERGAWQRAHEIRIYPDASGAARKSVHAAATDLALLRQAGFIVIAPSANPPVKDRVNAMNAMFCNARGERRYLVNAAACPVYAESLEQHVWREDGEPDKDGGLDHANDAAGYFIHAAYPVERPVTSIRLGMAF